jgi:hexulose-6-phosphate isomerase
MKIGLNAWSVQQDLGMEEMFIALSRAGFDGVELNIDEPGPGHGLTRSDTEEDYARIRGYSEKYGLKVIGNSSSLARGRAGVASEHEDYRKLVMKQLEAAKALGAPGILSSPGGMAFGVSLKEAHENAIRFYKSIRNDVEKLGLRVGLENTWSGFFLSPYDMISVIDEIGSPNFCAYLDLGNMIEFSNPEWWVEILGKYIGFVHIKDYRRNDGPFSGGTWQDVTHGSANWQSVMPALKKAGFDGYITGEVFRWYSDTPDIPWDDWYAKVAREFRQIIAYAE